MHTTELVSRTAPTKQTATGRAPVGAKVQSQYFARKRGRRHELLGGRDEVGGEERRHGVENEKCLLSLSACVAPAWRYPRHSIYVDHKTDRPSEPATWREDLGSQDKIHVRASSSARDLNRKAVLKVGIDIVDKGRHTADGLTAHMGDDVKVTQPAPICRTLPPNTNHEQPVLDARRQRQLWIGAEDAGDGVGIHSAQLQAQIWTADHAVLFKLGDNLSRCVCWDGKANTVGDGLHRGNADDLC